MGGLRRHIVHFEHHSNNPSLSELKARLTDLTGLALVFDEKYATVLGVTHPARLNASAKVYWIDKEGRRYIGVESKTSKFNYIEVSVLYLLKQLDGSLEEEFPLPPWAGQPWSKLPPDTLLNRFRAMLQR